MKDRQIGLEYEFLVVQRATGQSVTRDIMKRIWREWSKESHIQLTVDPATAQPIGVVYTQKDGREVCINTDAGIGIVEFGFLPFARLQECEDNMREILAEFLHIASRHDVVLLAYGMQPKTPWYFPDMRTEKIWYRAFFRFPHMAARHTTFTNIAANQPCIDVTFDESVRVINVFNALSGVIISLFANSAVGEWEQQSHHEEREWRWNEWFGHVPGESHAVGPIPQSFQLFRDYIDHIWSIPVRAVHREESLYTVLDLPLVRQYLRRETWSAMDLKTGMPDTVRPNLHDVNTLTMYVWNQARLKFVVDEAQPLNAFLNAYDAGTLDIFVQNHLNTLYVETRNIACQPWSDIMAAPAFLLGLVENIDEAEKIVEEKSWEEWRALREETIDKSLSVPGIVELGSRCVDISRIGLEKRGYGEAAYLAPLLKRIERCESPAARAVNMFLEEGIEAIIHENTIRL